MKALVLYDSVFGNTEKIARSIYDGLAEFGTVETAHISKLDPQELMGADLIIVGSPTHRGRPTEAVSAFLDSVPRGALQGTAAVAFDTRYDMAKWLLWLAGSATKGIARKLKKKQSILLLKPESFIVNGRQGPLQEGELERAGRWSEAIMAACRTAALKINKT